MNTKSLHQKIRHLLSFADVRIDGDRPWDIRVYDNRFYPRVMAKGSMGFGEAYMDGWWDCERIDELVARIFKAKLNTRISPWKEVFSHLRARAINAQKPSACAASCRHHYDIGNDLYLRMLDKRLIYSCGYWKNAACLDEAQEQKLTLVCRKLRLKPGMRVLDIGCGWGGTAKFMAEKCAVTVVGVTVSQAQATFAKNACRGLPVDIKLMDYRRVKGTFDRIVSIGMVEHVGYKNYRTFMRMAHRHLKPDGLFLLHTIGGNTSVRKTDRWIARYIFPDSMLPSAKQLTTAAEGLFVLEDWHNFGPDYDRTLISWFGNFQRHRREITEAYGERFYRMWKFYLLSCAGSFRARANQVWQIVFSPEGVPGGYAAPR